MNYGQLRDYALQLIRQYTIAGQPYAPTYNNQQDYLNQIPNLLNDALVTIATTFRRRDASVELDPEDGEIVGNYRRFALPEDLLDVKTNGLFIVNPDYEHPQTEYVRGYKLMPPDYILVPKHINKILQLDYYRRPQLVTTPMPADDEPIDATLPEQNCAAYYVAAHLVMHDNEFLYAALYNEFETKGARLAPVPTVEVGYMDDAYADMGIYERGVWPYV